MKFDERLLEINKCFLSFEADSSKNIENLTALCKKLLKADNILYTGPENEIPSENEPSGKDTSQKSDHIIQLSRKVQYKDRDFGSLCIMYNSKVNLSEDDNNIFDIIVSLIGIEEERKRTERQKQVYMERLIQAEKMAGVGTLANGVAHEFNNMLQAITGYAQFAGRAKNAKDVKESLDTILEVSKEAQAIIKNLLAFSRKGKEEKEFCELKDLIESVLLATEKQLAKRNINVVRKYDRSYNIMVNKAEILQVFLNIVINARDAMISHGGNLDISIKGDDNTAEIHFADTGRGIEDAGLSKAFEPFYTTKGSIGQGTIPGRGLGLFVSYGIVKQHNGLIEINNRGGKGCEVIIKLPVDNHVSAVKQDEKLFTEDKHSSASAVLTILVVDDEKIIRSMILKYFSSKGHKVEAVQSGEEAISIVKQKPFDVIFLDLVMPGLEGMEVLDEIQKLCSKSKILVMTGLANEELKKDIKRRDYCELLTKPFNVSEIEKRLLSLRG